MKLDYKSTLIGIILGIIGLFAFFLFLGNIKTELSLSFGDSVNSKFLDIQLENINTIISYNIRYDNKWDKNNNWLLRRERLCRQLRDYHPSIFGIQEGLLHQVAFIDIALPNYDYIGVGRDDGETKGEFCAIYFDTTRFEIIENSTFWLSENPEEVSIGWDAAMERICTYGLFAEKESEKKIWVFNTHFDHIGQNSRKESAELILNKINTINKQLYPVILMGDFNSTPESSPIKVIKNEFDDALDISSSKLSGPLGTFNGFDFKHPTDKRIDYIFAKNLKIRSYRHVDDRLKNNHFISDHLPVMVEVKLE